LIGSYFTPNFTRGNKLFELNNHLGNVLVTISDKKLGVDANSDGTVDYYTADVVSANDYYPGGMLMPGRSYSIANTNYRYGFNGQEKSDEIKGIGNSYTAEYWEYDPRLVRRWNVDPVVREFESPYACFSGNPILKSDLFGDSDSTFKTPGGGTIHAETSTAQVYDGSIQKLGNINIQPAKGTLRSFTVTGDNVANGTARLLLSLIQRLENLQVMVGIKNLVILTKILLMMQEKILQNNTRMQIIQYINITITDQMH
jgi:hypothetical protein